MVKNIMFFQKFMLKMLKLWHTGLISGIGKNALAGLKDFTFHNLRNLSVSYLAQSGESSAVLQRHLGHKSYKTTDRYIGTAHSDEERITKKLDLLIEEL